MHYLAKLIVEGEDRDDAMTNAVIAAEDLVEQEEFDWFDLNGRWGESKPHKVGSKKGKELLEEAADSGRDEFNKALAHIRYMLENYTDEEIYNEDFGEYRDKLPDGLWYLSRYQFAVAAGSPSGPHIYAPSQDVWGGRVHNDRELKSLLSMNDKNRKLWVVPIDFHN